VTGVALVKQSDFAGLMSSAHARAMSPRCWSCGRTGKVAAGDIQTNAVSSEEELGGGGEVDLDLVDDSWSEPCSSAGFRVRKPAIDTGRFERVWGRSRRSPAPT
jgi:hypothetical protein